MDHLAILIDKFGNIHPGRAPAPIYGLGADNLDNKKMSQEKIVQLTKDNANLEVSNKTLTSDMESLKVQAKKDMDEIKSLKDSNKSMDKKLKTSNDKLKKFEDEENAKDEVMKKEIIDKMPNMEAVINSADSKAVREFHKDMISKSAKKIEGEEGEEKASDLDDLNTQFRSVKKEE